MPRNRTSPRIITSSPMISLPVRPAYALFAYHLTGLERNAPPPVSWLLGLLAQIAIVHIPNRDRPPGQRTAEPAGEFQRHAGLKRGIDRLQVEATGIGRDARRGKGQARRSDDL